MDNFDTEQLIVEIENRTSLWDSTSAEYSNRDLKKKCWEEIVDIFGGEDLTVSGKKELGDTIQKRWKNIRGCFTREVKRKKELQSGSGSGPRKSEYMYFQQLQFLLKIVAIREPEPSEKSVEHSEGSNDIADPIIKRNKRKYENTDPDDETFMTALNSSTEKRSTHAILEQDEDRLFLLSLVGTLRKVSEEKKMATKIKIMTLLDEAIHNYTREMTRPSHGYTCQSFSHGRTNSGAGTCSEYPRRKYGPEYSTQRFAPELGYSTQHETPDIIKTDSPEYSRHLNSPGLRSRLSTDTNHSEES